MFLIIILFSETCIQGAFKHTDFKAKISLFLKGAKKRILDRYEKLSEPIIESMESMYYGIWFHSFKPGHFREKAQKRREERKKELEAKIIAARKEMQRQAQQIQRQKNAMDESSDVSEDNILISDGTDEE